MAETGEEREREEDRDRGRDGGREGRDGEIQTTLEVGENAGLVIGRGGITIQGMQRDTGARLFVDNATRVLHMSGTPEQVERAHRRVKWMLQI